jgi:arylsulfatase A-like enzyme
MRDLRRRLVTASIVTVLFAGSAAAQQQPNLVFFVADGLRSLSVTPQTTPTMAALRDQGVNFANPHSLFPTFTMANASGFATGHMLGDTGVFSNTIYTGYSVAASGGSVTPFIEQDAILGDVDEHFGGNFVNEETILSMARRKGYSTAAIGKIGPTLMFDHTERSGEQTVVIDDATGGDHAIPLSQEMKDRLAAAGLPLKTVARGDNSKAGDDKTPGTTVANVAQQGYFTDVATKVVLPMFKERNKPFVMVVWSRDPDGTQHNHGDNPLQITPGINGPTSLASIKNADDNLKQIRDRLTELGLADSTNIIVAADHGFSTISKQSETSPAAKGTYPKVPAGHLPMGFVAIDLSKALNMPLFDPDKRDADKKNVRVEDNQYPSRANGLIGDDPAKPDVVVATNGGSDLIYLPNNDKTMARRVIDALLQQDYVSGLFVNDDLGSFAGTLPLSAINVKGKAKTPTPAIVVNLRSFSTGCDQPVMCSVTVADTVLQQGQGMHGSFSRADTMNFMAAAGPSFKRGFVNEAPVSNADLGKTAAQVMGLSAADQGTLLGRVIAEALPNGTMPSVESFSQSSEPAAGGLKTVLFGQKAGGVTYLDAAGFPGRTVGLEERKKAAAR